MRSRNTNGIAKETRETSDLFIIYEKRYKILLNGWVFYILYELSQCWDIQHYIIYAIYVKGLLNLITIIKESRRLLRDNVHGYRFWKTWPIYQVKKPKLRLRGKSDNSLFAPSLAWTLEEQGNIELMQNHAQTNHVCRKQPFK